MLLLSKVLMMMDSKVKKKEKKKDKEKNRTIFRLSASIYYPTRLLPGFLYRTICLPPSRCDANS